MRYDLNFGKSDWILGRNILNIYVNYARTNQAKYEKRKKIESFKRNLMKALKEESAIIEMNRDGINNMFDTK